MKEAEASDALEPKPPSAASVAGETRHNYSRAQHRVAPTSSKAQPVPNYSEAARASVAASAALAVSPLVNEREDREETQSSETTASAIDVRVSPQREPVVSAGTVKTNSPKRIERSLKNEREISTSSGPPTAPLHPDPTGPRVVIDHLEIEVVPPAVSAEKPVAKPARRREAARPRPLVSQIGPLTHSVASRHYLALRHR
jgi:hypothetical protein